MHCESNLTNFEPLGKMRFNKIDPFSTAQYKFITKNFLS